MSLLSNQIPIGISNNELYISGNKTGIYMCLMCIYYTLTMNNRVKYRITLLVLITSIVFLLL